MAFRVLKQLLQKTGWGWALRKSKVAAEAGRRVGCRSGGKGRRLGKRSLMEYFQSQDEKSPGGQTRKACEINVL